MKTTLPIGILLIQVLLASCHHYTDEVVGFVQQPTRPVLTYRENNAVLSVQLVAINKMEYELEQMTFSLNGSSDYSGVENASLFFNDDSQKPVAQTHPTDEEFKINLHQLVKQDTLKCWICIKLKDDALKPTSKIQLCCKQINTNLGRVHINHPLCNEPLRIGVALRKHGQDNVHTSRIPGLVTTEKGTLIAMYDARHDSDDDLQGNIDIVINRSMDGGSTWLPMQTVLDMGKWGGLPEKYNGVSDGCILCDENTGNLFVAGLWMHGVLNPVNGKWIENLSDTSTVWNHQWRAHGSQPGYGIRQSSQFLISMSSDDGVTWSEPRNITQQVKKKEWWLLAPAPGRGITMEDGTLIMPAEGRDEKGLQFSTIIWSKDHGENWTVGTPAYYNTNECQVVELSDHSLMLNMRERSNRGRMERNGRAIAVTKDLGKTWSEHPTSRSALIEPACQASLLRHDYVENGIKKHILLFSNPNDKQYRNKMTIKISFDDGETWPEKYWMLLDEDKGAGYSCMTSINEQTIGILYEGSLENLHFQAIPLHELIKKH